MSTTDTDGFHFRYRLEGQGPTVRRFRCPGAEVLSPGAIVRFVAGEVRLAASGDHELLGVIVESDAGDVATASLDVIVDGDAVYGVRDEDARPAGTMLTLAGATGAQSVGPGQDAEFEVVVDCAADVETLVRIRVDKHHEIVLSAPAEQPPVPAGRTSRSDLTRERERELVAATAAGDPAACEQLVEAFLPAIAGVARLYRIRGIERAELLQEGVVGLLRACKRFDATLGTPFWAYASWWVRQAMQHLVAAQTRPIVLSDRALRGLAQIKEARRRHAQEQGHEPSIAELVEATGLPRDTVDRLLVAERLPRGLDVPLAGEDGAAGTMGDVLPDPVAEADYDEVLERMEIDRVRDLTEELDERERLILYDHYGLGRPAKTLREIGDGLGVSAERVRQIEEQTLAKLRGAVLESAAPT